MSESPTLSSETLPPEARWLTDRYEFLSELGRGGMAVEYLARERDSGRQVSIKLVSSRYPGDGDAIRRFARDARAVAGLHHPNIVRTIAIDERDDAVAVVSAYVHGETLRSVLGAAGGALSFDAAASILRDVAGALAHAHEQGIVHRDVRPENVFLLDGSRRALLSDFGVARSVDALLTSAGATITPEYLAPEQVDGRPVDARSDVYALGLLGWEMLAGRRPWQGETLHTVLQKQKSEPLPSLATLRPDIPAYLLAAIEGALAKDPAARWRDGSDFLTRLTPTAATQVVMEPAAVVPNVMPRRTIAGPAEPRGAVMHDRSVTVPVVAEPAAPAAAQAPLEPMVAPPVAPVVVTAERPRKRRWPLVAGVGGAALVGAIALMASGDDDRTRSVGNPALDSMRVAASGAPAGPTAGPTTRPATRPATRPTVRSEAGGEVRLPAARTGPAAGAAAATGAAGDLATRDARCGSAAADDQRACLLGQIEREDVALNNTYGALIAALRKGEGEEAVRALRAEQRAWLLERDQACRGRAPAKAGALWGAERVPCFADMSEKRESELSARLARGVSGG